MNRLDPDQIGLEARSCLGMFRLTAESAPPFIRMLCHSPAALRAYLGAEHELAHGQLSPRDRELIALTVAEINGSTSCLQRHQAQAREVGLGEREIFDARSAGAADSRADAMLRFVQAAVLQRGEISDEDFSILDKAGFTDAERVEIVLNIGLNIFTNYFHLLLGNNVPCPAAAFNEPAALRS